jgi:hypothetical protein
MLTADRRKSARCATRGPVGSHRSCAKNSGEIAMLDRRRRPSPLRDSNTAFRKSSGMSRTGSLDEGSAFSHERSAPLRVKNDSANVRSRFARERSAFARVRSERRRVRSRPDARRRPSHRQRAPSHGQRAPSHAGKWRSLVEGSTSHAERRPSHDAESASLDERSTSVACEVALFAYEGVPRAREVAWSAMHLAKHDVARPPTRVAGNRPRESHILRTNISRRFAGICAWNAWCLDWVHD